MGHQFSPLINIIITWLHIWGILPVVKLLRNQSDQWKFQPSAVVVRKGQNCNQSLREKKEKCVRCVALTEPSCTWSIWKCCCLNCCFAWCFEWVEKVQHESLGKWHYWSCYCEFKLLEVFKDCISYLLYVFAYKPSVVLSRSESNVVSCWKAWGGKLNHTV